MFKNFALLFTCFWALIIENAKTHRYFYDLSNTNSLANPGSQNNDVGTFQTVPPCSEDQLMTYLAQLQIINPESIVYASSVDGVDDLCLKVSKKLKLVDKYLSVCEPAEEKDLYFQLIKGIRTLFNKICMDGTFKKEFLDNWPCYHDLYAEFQGCTGPEDWTENMDDAQICNAYENIEHCYYAKTEKACGKDAARIMRSLTNAVLDSVLTVNCRNLQEKDTPNEKSSNSNIQENAEGDSVVDNTESVATINGWNSGLVNLVMQILLILLL